MSVGDAVTFPAESFVSNGMLKLSSSDALGPNPWTREQPVAQEFGLGEDDFNDAKLDAEREVAKLKAKLTNFQKVRIRSAARHSPHIPLQSF